MMRSYNSSSTACFDALSYQVRVALALGGNLVAYALAFGPLHRPLGAGVPALSLLSVAVAGWFLGMRAGILTGLLVFSLNTLLLDLAGGTDWNVMGGALSTAIVVLIGAVIGRLRDLLTEHKRAEEQLTHKAFYDPLTNLPNRALFIDRLEHAVRRTKHRKDYLFAVLLLDLDRFKVVNDGLSHIIGDQLLIAIAQRLEACLRPGDTIACLGGDEFTILLDNIKDVSDATRVADRIQKELTLPFNLSGQEVFTTASVGIALNMADYGRPEDLLRDAETAMYRTKAHGKAHYKVFDTSMHTRAVALLQLETDLRRAVECQEFRVHYQPIVSLETGRITGVEALVRWQHPQRGPVLPEEFIPVAEETGLIVPIGEWMLRTITWNWN